MLTGRGDRRHALEIDQATRKFQGAGRKSVWCSWWKSPEIMHFGGLFRISMGREEGEGKSVPVQGHCPHIHSRSLQLPRAHLPVLGGHASGDGGCPEAPPPTLFKTSVLYKSGVWRRFSNLHSFCSGFLFPEEEALPLAFMKMGFSSALKRK